tara:strand:+ start:626 stop:1408 length:783 start_codon:yes stop_codon:yes gene_type:complete
MKKVLVLLVALAFNSVNAQELNESSKKLKDSDLQSYEKIKIYSIDKWEDNEGMVNHSINEQSEAFLRIRNAREQTTFLWEYYSQAVRDTYYKDKETDWVMLENFYNTILKHNKDVVQPVISISLKGFTIVDKLEGEDSKFTTIGGIRGVLKAETINDGRISKITFKSSDEKNNLKRISETEAISCMNGMSSYYNINFKELAAGYLPRGNRRFDADKGSFFFMIKFLKDDLKDPVFSLTITHKSLNFISLREKREGIKSDF